VRTARELQISHQDYKNPEFVEVKYIRYVDNFLIGVLRSKLPSENKGQRRKRIFFSELYQARKKTKIRGRKKKDFFLFDQEKAKRFLFFDYLLWKVQSAF
jgi:hypothetical protein